jgi:spore germination protein KC
MGADAGGSQGASSVSIQTSTGKSFYDAIHNFLKYSSRRVTFSHNRIVILGKELAQSGVSGVFDDMERDYQFRRTNWLLVAKNTTQEILESTTGLGTIPVKEIDQMLRNLTKDPLILPVNINDFLVGLKSEGTAALVPLIEIETLGPNPAQEIKIEKTAVFKNDRLVDVLNTDESQGLLWLATKQKGGPLVLPYPSSTGQKTLSVEITDDTSRIRPRLTETGLGERIPPNQNTGPLSDKYFQFRNR